MASNNNNNKSTILLTHTDRQTTQPRTEWEHKHRERHAPQLRLCAPRAKIEATDEEREAGRQAGSEGGRESSEREGVGISGGPRRWVVSQVSCPATIVLFVPCVRVCVRANIIIPQALPKICHQHQHTSDMQINILVCLHPRDFLFKFLQSESELMRWRVFRHTHTLTTHHLSNGYLLSYIQGRSILFYKIKLELSWIQFHP
jgi:hypothetical protein